MYSWIQEGHKIFRALLMVQLIIAIIIGLVTGELMIAFWLGIPIVALPLYLSFTSEKSEISAHAMGIGSQLMTALHIHQSFGLIEMHFEIFSLLAVLAVFRNWKVIASATVFIAIHHISFFLLQVEGFGVYAFEEGHVTFTILLLHALFALVEGFILMYMTKRSHEEGVGAAALEVAINDILADQQKLNLRVDIDKSIPLLSRFDELLSALRELVNDATSLANQVADTSAFMQSSTQDLNGHVMQSNHELGSISTASEEIAVTLQDSAERTNAANDITREAQQDTSSSRKAVESTKTTINSLRDRLNRAATTNQELNDRCSSISESMRSITAVADQTNLLALNAAIESARAGEHGRGFAVVADEVRTLAIRSKESADEISTITEQLVASTASSVSQMNECVELVDQAVSDSDNAASFMQNIEEQIQAASDNMMEVATAAVEQEAASSSIAKSTARIHELSTLEANTAAELEAKAKELAQKCQSMLNTVNRFVI
ncbi:methyl-accepting chemotaxis protein [Alteromonas gilva]|uniref:Methyl-accepting chemotaxis protein n=1 Tax=Alteromonas gilva TaxID=2987522 RepID=A0ABT5KY78_9ALTE|nr:methyl-accepting chemotaxis protein [Alteromonas gilva]MDC8829588.1 methyl-accepting chemotaxis protein [Alteromonas gilva]